MKEMKKIQKLFLAFLFVLPLFLVGGVSENNEIDEESRSPISSSLSGGVGKEWEVINEDYKDSRLLVSNNESLYVLAYTDDFATTKTLLKFNLNGSLIWEKTYSELEDKTINSMEGDGQNIYLACSEPWVENQGSVYKINSSGDIVWESLMSYFRFSLYVQNNDVLAGGYGNIIRINSTTGEQKEEYKLLGDGGSRSDFLRADENFLYVSNAHYGSEKYFLEKYDFSNNSVWSIETSSSGDFLAEEGSLIILSNQNISKHQKDDGSLIWQKSHNKDYCSIVKNNNLYYMAGGDEYKLFLSCLDDSGNFVWNRTWGTGGLYDLVWINESLYTLGSNSDEIVLTKWVKDEISPELTDLQDQSFEQRDDDNYLDPWYIEDENKCNYTLYLNGSVIETGDSTHPQLNIDFSDPLGIYNYTLVVDDIAGNRASDSALITIQDTISPTMYGYYNNNTQKIVWTIEDRNPASYYVLRDGEEISSGSWVDGEENSLSVSVDGNYTIVARDTSGNEDVISILVGEGAGSDSDTADGGPVDLLWFNIVMGVVIASVAVVGYLKIKKMRNQKTELNQKQMVQH